MEKCKDVQGPFTRPVMLKGGAAKGFELRKLEYREYEYVLFQKMHYFVDATSPC